MPKDSWKDLVIKGFGIMLFALLMAWGSWATVALLSMNTKLAGLDSLKRNWVITGRNMSRIAEFHGADSNSTIIRE